MKSPSAVPTTIDDYIAGFPRGIQTALTRVRRAIRRAVPDAEEAISYQIPAFRLNGRILIYFAGWASHYSLYPANDRLLAAFRDELAPYEASGKGTIRFPLDEPVPVKLIEAIAKFRARQSVERSRTTKTKTSPKAPALGAKKR